MSGPELWLPVVSYEGHYEVSNQGRIRSLDRILPHGRYGQRRTPGKLMSGGRNTNGRLQVHLSDGVNPTRYRQVHCLVYEAFVGPVPDGLEVCHDNGDPLDNRVTNLRVDTHSGNMRDKRRHGTLAWQDACPNGHLRSEHPQYVWRNISTCGTCRAAKMARANRKRKQQVEACSA